PADGDAEGMPADGAASGLTMLLEGTYASAGVAPTPFRTISRDRVTTEVPIALELGDARRTAAVRAVVDATSALDGLDPRIQDEASAGALLARLAAGSRAVVE